MVAPFLKIKTMENLTTNIENGQGFGNTTTFSKTFTTYLNGRKLQLGVYRSYIDLCGGHKTKTSFTLEYNGEQFGSNDMKREQLNYFISEINKGTFDIKF